MLLMTMPIVGKQIATGLAINPACQSLALAQQALAHVRQGGWNNMGVTEISGIDTQLKLAIGASSILSEDALLARVVDAYSVKETDGTTLDWVFKRMATNFEYPGSEQGNIAATARCLKEAARILASKITDNGQEPEIDSASRHLANSAKALAAIERGYKSLEVETITSSPEIENSIKGYGRKMGMLASGVIGGGVADIGFMVYLMSLLSRPGFTNVGICIAGILVSLVVLACWIVIPYSVATERWLSDDPLVLANMALRNNFYALNKLEELSKKDADARRVYLDLLKTVQVEGNDDVYGHMRDLAKENGDLKIMELMALSIPEPKTGIKAGRKRASKKATPQAVQEISTTNAGETQVSTTNSPTTISAAVVASKSQGIKSI